MIDNNAGLSKVKRTDRLAEPVCLGRRVDLDLGAMAGAAISIVPTGIV